MGQCRNGTRTFEGGLWTSPTRRRVWRLGPRDSDSTRPLPCKSEQWFFVRSKPNGKGECDSLGVEFVDAEGRVFPRRIPLLAPNQNGHARDATGVDERIGWIQAPDAARTIRLTRLENGCDPELIAVRAIAERDTKCHPLANVPPWSDYRPPFPIERVILPRSLAALEPVLAGSEVRVIDQPASLRKLAAAAMGAAIVLDPAWVESLELTLADIERVAPITWMVMDLESVARLVRAAGAADARVAMRRSPHGLMSARVEYADVSTRGFALMDVFPFGAYCPRRGFSMRVLVANRSWRKYAESCGFAPLLSSQTPFETQCNDVVSATRAIGQGELVATDLPWIVAGAQGTPIAPELARHALHMHLGGDLPVDARYWNRWDDTRVVVRDIADMTRRYPYLRAIRWGARMKGGISLGLSLRCPANDGATERHLLIRSGRVDCREPHDGVAPEPLMILMRGFVSEWQRQTPWARRFLTGTTLTWQFESAEGQRYGVLFDAADGARGASPAELWIRGSAAANEVGSVAPTQGKAALQVPADVGVFGDRSLAFQAGLTAAVRGWIERLAK